MSLELLDKTRRINSLLNKQESEKIDFTDFCRVLSHTLEVNVVLSSRKGKVLGLKEREDIPEIPQLAGIRYGDYLDGQLQNRFMNILSTKENVNLLTLGFLFEAVEEYQAMIAPICMAGIRLGSLFIYRKKIPFSIDDIILTEYSTTVIGLAMQRAESEEISKDKVRITRSVIVNALKKCESAGIIQTKSSGMKGTSVRIVNDLFSYELIAKNIL